MNFLKRPWAAPENETGVPLGPSDCFLAEAAAGARRTVRNSAPLLDWKVGNQVRQLVLLPYPKTGKSDGLPKVRGLPARPRAELDPQTSEEIAAAAALARMNQVIARIQELEAALDDPEQVWTRLADAWRRAEDEKDPRMAEIVRQARDVLPQLQDLEKRIRRVLRRHRELTPLEHVQEIDRASMLWLVRQPGRNTAERAGVGQRILATVRHENFDTLENRVLHAYVVLASHVAREWLREHYKASMSLRFAAVEKFRKYCRRLAGELDELGVGLAPAGVTPNYVLMDDRAYRDVLTAWELLLRRKRTIDDLWSWQAQSWTDFCVLAVTLSLHALEEAELIAQSPIVWNGREAVTGRWFSQDNPLAVFWLRDSGRIVEVQARPGGISTQQAVTKAHVWLRISEPNSGEMPRRVPVWTLHCFAEHNVVQEVEGAVSALSDARRVPSPDADMRQGLVTMQAHGRAACHDADKRSCRVRGIALDATGETLSQGMRALGEFVRGTVSKEAV